MATLGQVDFLCDIIMAIEHRTPTLAQRKLMLSVSFETTHARIQAGLSEWKRREGVIASIYRHTWDWTDSTKEPGKTVPSPNEVLLARTANGAWTKKVLAVWGVSWPPPRGWRADLEEQWLAQQRDL